MANWRKPSATPALAAACLAAALAVTLLAACGSDKSRPRPDAPVPAPAATMNPAPKRGLELVAYGRANRVHLSLTNHDSAPVVAGPKCFAVLKQGDKEPAGFRIGVDVAQLPVKRLARGDSINGNLQFMALDDVAGCWLIYQSPDPQPVFARCVIEPLEDAAATP